MTSKILTLVTLPLAVLGQTYSFPGTGQYTVTQDTGGDVPLASKHFDYPYLPEHADSGDGPRGTQSGYNICNSTTLGDDSMCQTGFVNNVTSFCLWASPTANQVVATQEQSMVAACTTDDFGTRVIPPGALQGVQFIQTPDYVEVIGFIDQTAIGLQANDTGGEEDNKGADMRGNPLGSLLYSSAFGPGKNSPYQQITDWAYFVGGGVFCFKACDPSSPQSASLCDHVYDRIGCAYNDPADYASVNGTFQSCKGDNQLPPGVYVDGGVTKTYYQPAESLGAITTIPYTAAIPKTSQCSTFSSAELFKAVSSSTSSSAASQGTTKPGSGSQSPAGPASTGGQDNTSSSPSSFSTTNLVISLSLGLAGASLILFSS